MWYVCVGNWIENMIKYLFWKKTDNPLRQGQKIQKCAKKKKKTKQKKLVLNFGIERVFDLVDFCYFYYHISLWIDNEMKKFIYIFWRYKFYSFRMKLKERIFVTLTFVAWILRAVPISTTLYTVDVYLMATWRWDYNTNTS